MKRLVTLAALMAIVVGALYYNHRRQPEVTAGPEALSKWAADVSRETSRVPMRITRLSDDDEIRIGDDMAAPSLANRHQQYTYSAADLAFEQYVNDVGTKLAARAKRKLPYKYYFIPEEHFFNAYALPGGHIVIGKGLVRAMDSEDQLAAVLGHEIEHVDRFHCADRVQIEARSRRLPLGGLVTLPIRIFQAGYSKEQEMEADREGTFLMVRSGYAAEGAVRLFEILERLEPKASRRASNPVQVSARVAG